MLAPGLRWCFNRACAAVCGLLLALMGTPASAATLIVINEVPGVRVDGKSIPPGPVETYAETGDTEVRFALPDHGWTRLTLTSTQVDGKPRETPKAEDYWVELRPELKLGYKKGYMLILSQVPGARCGVVRGRAAGTWTRCLGDPAPRAGERFALRHRMPPNGGGDGTCMFFRPLKTADAGASSPDPDGDEHHAVVLDARPGVYEFEFNGHEILTRFRSGASCSASDGGTRLP